MHFAALQHAPRAAGRRKSSLLDLIKDGSRNVASVV